MVFCRLFHHALYVGSPHTFDPLVSSAGDGLVVCVADGGGKWSWNYIETLYLLSDHAAVSSVQLTCAASVLLGLFLS